MNKKILVLADISSQPFKRIKRSLSEKNVICSVPQYEEEYDYVVFSNKIDNFQHYYENLKFKYFLYFHNLEGLSIDYLDEIEIYKLLKSKNIFVPQESYPAKNFLGFFCFNFFDSQQKNDLLYKLYNGAKDIRVEYDKYEEYFCTKHLIGLLVDIIREPDSILENPNLELNNYVNLAYIENYKLGQLAEFCSNKIEFISENTNNVNFYGNGEKLRKIFCVTKSFNLAEGILGNQR